MNYNIIDVSSWQTTADFLRAKNAGISKVILRAGYGCYTVDKKFCDYIKSALAAGMEVGVYWFIYARNTSEMRQNCNKLCEVIKPYHDKIKLGVWFDFEKDSERYAPKLSTNDKIAFLKIFMERMKTEGYKGGLYSNLDCFRRIWSKYKDIRKIPLWSAYYTSGSTLPAELLPCVAWQKTSGARIDGFNTNVDAGFWYGFSDEKPEDPENEYYKVTTKNDNLLCREGPGISYKAISSFKKGTIVEALEYSGNWIRVKGTDYLGKNVEGWSSKTFLKKI